MGAGVGAEQLIELDLERLGVAVLGVLDEEHHQEGDDGGGGIDDQLPGVAVVEDRATDEPDEDDDRLPG